MQWSRLHVHVLISNWLNVPQGHSDIHTVFTCSCLYMCIRQLSWLTCSPVGISVDPVWRWVWRELDEAGKWEVKDYGCTLCARLTRLTSLFNTVHVWSSSVFWVLSLFTVAHSTKYICYLFVLLCTIEVTVVIVRSQFILLSALYIYIFLSCRARNLQVRALLLAKVVHSVRTCLRPPWGKRLKE